MAFAVLPYPSMDFTPLDVLTADELDQLVANINAVNGGTAGTSQIADGAITTAKLASSAVSSTKIDWPTIIGTIVDSDVAGSGYIDLGTIRIQWKNNRYSSLTTTAGAFNSWDDTWSVPFKTATYAVTASQTSDVGNIAGVDFKVTAKTSAKVTLNLNHTGSINNTTVYYTVIGIGLKP